MPAPQRSLVVVGYGMVGHKLLELVAIGGGLGPGRWATTVVAEEPRGAYDRVHLTKLFHGQDIEDLSLADQSFFDRHCLSLRLEDAATCIDRNASTVTTASGARIDYDILVLSTGSTPFVPPVPGRDAKGCFVYRTVEDAEAIKAAASEARRAVVVGGGLLGLEAADALVQMGVATSVVEVAPRLMPAQVDEGGGRILGRRIADIGIEVSTGISVESIQTTSDGRVRGVALSNGTALEAQLVVFSAGVRPRDELGRTAGLQIAELRGVVIDASCRTSDPDVFAIGDCASFAGRSYGFIGPGYAMARVVARQLLEDPDEAHFEGADCSTKLKLLGVDVASFGDAFASSDDSEVMTFDDPVERIYRRIVLGPDREVRGGVLVGDASGYEHLLRMSRGEMTVPADLATLALPSGLSCVEDAEVLGADAVVCSCNAVTKQVICRAIADGDLTDVRSIKAVTMAGTGCGGCIPTLAELLNCAMAVRGQPVKKQVCEHFDYTRQELFDVVRVERIGTFAELLQRHGRGRGCEVCRPVVASILASLGSEHILNESQASLQDTNDHFLANLQRDGSYSVVPRVPGGEITPARLIALGNIAIDFGLYTKITGAQRVDLFGARVEQLPEIWRRLIEVGFESGHAYGKALRTVKSCVGSTWCRYGVQDSVDLAIRLEMRYRGLRAPHKIKCAVSGCVRECAEAQGKDVGVIATQAGWNLYVGGNGGMRPRHADLLISDIDETTLIRLIDRFLMFYVRTADRLERTATWIEKMEGGIEYLRSVIVDDALGVCDELEREMTRHVESYRCEWKATLESPERLRLFRTFVNSDEPDPDIVFETERAQPRPVQHLAIAPRREGRPRQVPAPRVRV